jgi:hypothetical protein
MRGTEKFKATVALGVMTFDQTTHSVTLNMTKVVWADFLTFSLGF